MKCCCSACYSTKLGIKTTKKCILASIQATTHCVPLCIIPILSPEKFKLDDADVDVLTQCIKRLFSRKNL